VKDAPDVWAFLRTSYLRTSNYQNNDWKDRPISASEQAGGIETKNFERWLYQRDAPGYETQPDIKIQQAIKMWMVQTDKYYDYIARAGKKIGFDIDDKWVAGNDSVAIKVTYFDNHAGELILVYSNAQKLIQKTQLLNGDGKLKTVTFFLSGIKPNSLENKFDFALEAGKTTEKIVISMVRVIKAAENSVTVSSNRHIFDNTGNIKISYNPVNKKLSVNSRNNIRIIEMYDISGKKVRSQKGDGTVIEMHTGGLKPGVYLVQVNDTTGNRKRGKISIV
jgi:hypothetical protein